MIVCKQERNNNKKLKGNKTTPHKDLSKNPKSTNVSRKKKTIVAVDYILKNVGRWRLDKRMESNVSVRFIPGASTNGMAHHVKGCLGDISPDTIILHHETNDMKIGNAAEKIANNRSNLAVNIRSEKTKVLISKLKFLNNFWKKKYFVENLSFIENQKIKKMLNQSGLHLNEYRTRRLVKKFYYNLIN